LIFFRIVSFYFKKTYLLMAEILLLLLLCNGIYAEVESSRQILYTRKTEGYLQLFRTDESFKNEVRLTFDKEDVVCGMWYGDEIIFISTVQNMKKVYTLSNKKDIIMLRDLGFSQGFILEKSHQDLYYSKVIETGSSEIRVYNFKKNSDNLLFSHQGDQNLYPAVNQQNINEIGFIYDWSNWTPNRDVRIRYLQEREDEIIQECNNRADSNLSMSPDGRYLAWSQAVSGYITPFLITIYDREKDVITDLTEILSKYSITPSFSPDSKFICAGFADTQTGMNKVYQIDIEKETFTLLKTFPDETYVTITDIK